MILFFDTSALVKFFHREEGTDVVISLISELESKSSGPLDHVGSIPTSGTMKPNLSTHPTRLILSTGGFWWPMPSKTFLFLHDSRPQPI